jgi:glycosyltransferase involved in cell wall biosynthesis
MKVSIITISYNSEKTIEDTIRSVISQSWNEMEYIIIDGGSSDSTKNIIEKYRNKISHFVSEPDHGIYDAMNKGLKLASGDLIGIINSDDIFADENVIRDVVIQIEKEKTDSIYADLVYVQREDVNKILRYWKAGPYKPGHFRKGWMPPHPTFFVRKKIYDQHGYFNTDLKSAADYEIMLRFIERYKISVSYLPRIITKMRIGGKSNQSLKNRIIANREDRAAWRINGLRPGVFTLTRKPLSKILQFLKRPQ